MKICEIFKSIQGESSYAGLPCLFIRMTGCNLRCSYCDTTYAYFEGKDLSEDEIMDEVKHAGTRLVEITGGEPFLQKEVYNLIKRLLDEGYKVLVETNGSMSIKDVDRREVIILDTHTTPYSIHPPQPPAAAHGVINTDEIKF